MKVHAPRVRERVEQRLSRQRVTKSILSGVLFDDPRFHPELERVERRLGLEPRGAPGDLERKAQTDERGGGEQALGVATEATNAMAHGIEEVRRQARSRRSLLAHGQHDLLGVKRVALGERVNGGDDFRHRSRRSRAPRRGAR